MLPMWWSEEAETVSQLFVECKIIAQFGEYLLILEALYGLCQIRLHLYYIAEMRPEQELGLSISDAEYKGREKFQVFFWRQ